MSICLLVFCSITDKVYQISNTLSQHSFRTKQNVLLRAILQNIDVQVACRNSNHNCKQLNKVAFCSAHRQDDI